MVKYIFVDKVHPTEGLRMTEKQFQSIIKGCDIRVEENKRRYQEHLKAQKADTESQKGIDLKKPL